MTARAGTPGRAAPRAADLTDPDVALAAARRAGVGLRHDLGQHLLVDRSVLDTIVEALEVGAGDEVLEVGPGIGTLTVELAARARRVVAVDLDPACARATRSSVAAAGGRAAVEIATGDALALDFGMLRLTEGWLAAGNIPYSITGAVLEHLLGGDSPPRRAVLLVQREVARRLAAPPGGWSLATVAVRTVAEARTIADVAPQCFLPPPRVWSSVLLLTPARPVPAGERDRLLTVARACFQLRRKILRHGVGRACGGDEAAAAGALAEAGIDPGRRPGELDLDEWRRLAASVAARCDGGPVGAA